MLQRCLVIFYLVLGCQLASFTSNAAVINCNSFWRSYGGSFPCEEVAITGFNGNIGGKTFRFFHYSTNWDNAAAKLHVLDVTAQAVRDAVPVYKGYGKIPSVFFVLSSIPHAGDTNNFSAGALADPLGQSRGEPCPVTIFPSSLNMSDARLKQLIAHEMFHCFQAENFPAQMNGAQGINHVEWGKVTGWWAEGTADYFSNLVYPSNNWEHEQQKYYDANTQIHLQPVFYSTSSFFQSIGNDPVIGPQGILRFLQTLPSQGGHDQQRTPLSSEFLFRSGFHDFAKGLILSNIQDSGGGNLPTAYSGQSTSINAEKTTHTYPVSSQPFTVRTTQFILEPGYKYTFTNLMGEQLHAGVFASIRKGSSKSWHDLSTADKEFDTSCDESPYMVEVLVTRTDDSADSFSSDVTVKVEDKECQCRVDTGRVDPCYVGRWEFDNSVLGTIFDQLGLPIHLLASSGQLLIDIDARHNITFWFFDWYHKLSMQQTGLDLSEVENTYSGTTQALLGVTPQGHSCLRVTDDQSAVKSVVNLPRHPPIEWVVQGALTDDSISPDTHFGMTCTARRMTWLADVPAKGERGPVKIRGAMDRVSPLP
jgi:hypothetical protein